MEKGIISKEFYIGRYIYLTTELRKLPNITFTRLDGYAAVSIVETDPVTGKNSKNAARL